MIPKTGLSSVWRSRVNPMRHSIIRRSSYSIVFFLGGYFFYYLTVVLANVLLSVEDFGRFYLGWSILNVLSTPGSVIALFLSVHFASVFREGGIQAIPAALTSAASRLIPWTIAAVAGAELLLYLAGSVVGADSSLLIALLPLSAASFFAADFVRSILQGTLRFVWFGLSWLAGSMAQCALSAVGLLLIRAPWTSFLAMLVANAGVLVAVLFAIKGGDGRREPASSSEASPQTTTSLRRALPFCGSLGIVVLLHNADIILAYLSLSGMRLGAYTAAAVLPKAIFAATQPVVQVTLPVMVHVGDEARNVRSTVMKAAGLVLGLAVVGAAFLWLLSGTVCGGRYGIRFCEAPLMLTLAAAVIPVALIRVLTMADVSAGRFWVSILPAIGLGLFLSGAAVQSLTPLDLAQSYLVACWGTLVVYAIIRLAPGRRRAAV